MCRTENHPGPEPNCGPAVLCPALRCPCLAKGAHALPIVAASQRPLPAHAQGSAANAGATLKATPPPTDAPSPSLRLHPPQARPPARFASDKALTRPRSAESPAVCRCIYAFFCMYEYGYIHLRGPSNRKPNTDVVPRETKRKTCRISERCVRKGARRRLWSVGLFKDSSDHWPLVPTPMRNGVCLHRFPQKLVLPAWHAETDLAMALPGLDVPEQKRKLWIPENSPKSGKARRCRRLEQARTRSLSRRHVSLPLNVPLRAKRSSVLSGHIRKFLAPRTVQCPP